MYDDEVDFTTDDETNQNEWALDDIEASDDRPEPIPVTARSPDSSSPIPKRMTIGSRRTFTSYSGRARAGVERPSESRMAGIRAVDLFDFSIMLSTTPGRNRR